MKTRTTRRRPTPKRNRSTFNRIALAVAFAGIFDLLTKRAIVASLVPGERRTIVPGWLQITYAQNTHGAMGLFGDRTWLLIVLALIVIGVLSVMLRDLIRESPLAQVGFGLVLGGAIGNVIDRVLHHFVIDFIAPRWFYIFNGADSCITAGLVLMAIASLRNPGPRASVPPSEAQSPA